MTIRRHIRSPKMRLEYNAAKMEKIILQENRCFWCGLIFTAEDPPTGDHIVELAEGGHPTDRKNIVAAHKECNGRRSQGALTFIAHIVKSPA